MIPSTGHRLRLRRRSTASSPSPHQGDHGDDEGDDHHEGNGCPKFQKPHRVHHDEVSAGGVQAVELLDGGGQREHVVLAERQSVSVRVILRLSSISNRPGIRKSPVNSNPVLLS
jgi:hypothetical protein